MHRMRLLALAGLTALALATTGCASILGEFTGPGTTSDVVTAATFENSYTTTASLATVWLKSGKATPSQAAVTASLDGVVYSDVVAVRTAVAQKDNPALAAGLKLLSQAEAALVQYISDNGGSVEPAK